MPPLHERDERIVQRHHPVLASAVDRHRQLRRLAFRYQVRDGTRVEQHFARRHAAAAGLAQQHLRDDAPQIFREPQLHFRTPFGRRLRR